MTGRKPTFLRWIEEAEGRRLCESAALEPDAASPRVVAPPPAVATPPQTHAFRTPLRSQIRRDRRPGERLSWSDRTRRV
jgi:hypothetical protein